MKTHTMMIKSLASFLYPEYCLVCEERLEIDRRFVCAECFEKLPRYGGMERYYDALDRLSGLVPFTEYQSDLVFTNPSTVRTLMHNIKYNGFPTLGYELARDFAVRHKELGHFSDTSVIIPIPLIPKRLRKRRYNQSTYIAKGISEVYNLPIVEDWLQRHTSKGTQTRRGKEARWKSIEHAFYVPEGADLEGKRVLIVDDILTTGATLISAGRAVINAGAESISFYTLALDILY